VTNETNVQETPVPAEETTEVTEESEPEVAVTKKPSKKAEKKTDSAEKTEEKKPAKRLELPSNTHINMSDIDLPEMWNRDSAGDLKGLTQSIQTGGQKVPVLVRPNPEKPGRWLLVDGRRRYMVMQSIKAKTIMAVVSNDATEAEAQRTAIVVNLARAGHNPVEIATAFQFCIDSGMKQKEIALEGGFSDGYVSQHLAILDFPEDIIKLTKSGKLLFAHLRVFKGVFNETDIKFFNKLTYDTVQKNLTPEEADNMVVEYKRKKKEKEEASGKKSTAKKVGRPAKKKTKMKDYSKYVPKSPSPTKIRDVLTKVVERYDNSNTKKHTTFYEGAIWMGEVLAGFQEIE
jgi:ParB/RepB/Spo0J family partition protein